MSPRAPSRADPDCAQITHEGGPVARPRLYLIIGIMLICQEARMIKLVYCISKKPGMSDAAFFQYWAQVHGPIGARIPGLRRLVQSHRVAVPGDARSSDYDGMAE